MGAGARQPTPHVAATPGELLRFEGDIPFASALEAFSKREQADLRTVRPGPTDDVRSAITAEATKHSTGVRDVVVSFEGAASGARGSIKSKTNLRIHFDPNDPHGWIVPTNVEMKLVDPPEWWKFYPVTITYERTITYSDDYQRSVDVDLYSQVHFDYEAWHAATASLPDITAMTLDQLASMQGDSGGMSVRVIGDGNLDNVVARDYPSLPDAIRQELLAGNTQLGYLVLADATGNSLNQLSASAASALQQSEPAFPIHLSDVAGEFSYLDKTAGEQYDLLRAYLESYDQVLIAKWIESIRDRLESPGSPDLGPAIPSEPNDSWLNDVLEAISDFWSSLPAPLRGTLKAIGKAALAVGAVVGLAALIVLLAPVELTVAGVALAIGAVLLGASFLYSIVTRSIESVETGKGNPLTVFLISIADAIGISGIYEGITNESLLSGRPLNLDEEGQYERGVGGFLQLLMTFLGVRAARRGKVPTTLDDAPPRPADPARPAEPGGSGEPGAPAEEPFFDPAEIDSALDQGFERPNVKGGRSNPRIGDRRVPGEPPRRLDIDDLPRRPGETARQALLRITRVLGKRLDEFPALRNAWNRARAKVLSERGPLTRDNYRELYDKTREQFWRNVRDDDAASQIFSDAGFEFGPNRTTAPRLADAPAEVPAEGTRVSLDHVLEKAQGNNWQKALDADNLEMTFQDPNSYREIVQMRHPDLRTPPPTPEPTPAQ